MTDGFLTTAAANAVPLPCLGVVLMAVYANELAEWWTPELASKADVGVAKPVARTLEGVVAGVASSSMGGASEGFACCPDAIETPSSSTKRKREGVDGDEAETTGSFLVRPRPPAPLTGVCDWCPQVCRDLQGVRPTHCSECDLQGHRLCYTMHLNASGQCPWNDRVPDLWIRTMTQHSTASRPLTGRH